METIFSWFDSSSPLWPVALKLSVIIAILIIAKRFGIILIDKSIRKAITSDKYASSKAEEKREDTLIGILNALLKAVVWIFGATLILAQLGVNVGPLIAGASIAGIAIGFGAQSIVKDFVTGIFIILENQYRIGDTVQLNDAIGTVEDITIRQTILRDAEGHRHYVPNGSIGKTTNLTMDFSNLILYMDISYDEDLDKVKKVINQVGKELSQAADFKDKIIEMPQFLRIQSFGAHAISIRIMGKMKPGMQWQIAGEMRLRLKKAFDAHKIEIPYQQLVIHKVAEK